MSNKPLVSMIVPVYNAEKFLRRCLDSLVYQTLEDIEIICVNNGSEDGSLDILNEYHELFPDKLFVITIEHHPRAGHGRNVGMQHARADYFAFCDSDDMIHLKTLEWMYEEAMKNDCDLVFAPHWRVEDRHFLIGGRFPAKLKPQVQDLMVSASPSVWAKLIHRSLIDKIGYMPEDISAEDVPYSYMLHTNAERIGYIDNPIYYYINRSDSEVRSFLSPKKLENIPAQDYGIEHGNQEYRDMMVAKTGCLTNVFIHRDWVFADHFIQRAKELMPVLEENEFFKAHYPNDYASLQRYVQLTDDPMARIAYVNGFGGISDERLDVVAEKAFYEGAEVVVLDEKNCDVTENPNVKAAYDDGDIDFVVKYFALKKIYETGGIFIGDIVKIDAPLNFVRYFPAFFGYLDDSSFTDDIFGGAAGNKALGLILGTYENGGKYRNKRLPLADRIKNILSVVYNVPLDQAKTTTFGYKDFILFAPDILIVDPSDGLGALFPKMHFTTHDFSSRLSEAGSGEYVVLKYSTLRSICKNSNASGVNTGLNNKIRALQAKVHEYETSDSWKITSPLRKFSRTGVGKQFLKLYRGMLRIRSGLRSKK